MCDLFVTKKNSPSFLWSARIADTIQLALFRQLTAAHILKVKVLAKLSVEIFPYEQAVNSAHKLA